MKSVDESRVVRRAIVIRGSCRARMSCGPEGGCSKRSGEQMWGSQMGTGEWDQGGEESGVQAHALDVQTWGVNAAQA